MRLRIRALRLRIVAEDGVFGTTLQFGPGLNVLQAPNTSGKSTCMQAVLFALGMEGMLSATHKVPFPHVMTDELEEGDRRLAVIESEVWLEIANQHGDIVTIRRSAKGPRDSRLVSVYMGPLLTAHDSRNVARSRDFYARLPGAASQEAGFHTFLSAFIGWELPTVPNHNGSETQLYLECLFAFIFVEQKRGWAGINSQVPTRFGIKDAAKRSIEFLLKLECQQIASERERLKRALSSVRENWRLQSENVKTIARRIGGQILHLPDDPTGDWPPQLPTILSVPLGEQWVSMSDAIATKRAELDAYDATPIPTTEQDAAPATQRLATLETQYRTVQRFSGGLADQHDVLRTRLSQVDQRIVALELELRRFQDAKRLLQLGSDELPALVPERCPTCHQSVVDSTYPPEATGLPMSVDENIDFVREQVGTFVVLRQNIVRDLSSLESQMESQRKTLVAMRGEIRSIRVTLVSDSRIPSLAAVRKRVELESEIRVLSTALDEFDTCIGKLGEYAVQWRQSQSALQSLPTTDLSEHDLAKVYSFEQSIIAQLQQYGFRSVHPQDIRLDKYSLRPEHGGYELQFDLSASDLIRAIWAYLLGFLEVQTRHDTNHPGLLLFDEPRQQETQKVSFTELLARAAKAAERDQQIVLATSEDLSTLREMLVDVPHHLQSFSGNIIGRVE